ncbi:MAG: ATP-binding protein [Clostridiales bacterium]|nr:ATP-binding protein [Clostridiales bacterium]
MEDLSLHILDLAQNSISAGATLIELSIRDGIKKGEKWVEIRDNGKGMDPEQINRVGDPFYTTRTTRKVGLGIPMFKASTEASGGKLQITSQLGKGTTLEALFISDHIDCIPLGNMEETITALIYMNPEVDFVYIHESNGRKFLLDTRQIREVLGEVNIDDPEIINWIKKFVEDGLEELNGGV